VSNSDLLDNRHNDDQRRETTPYSTKVDSKDHSCAVQSNSKGIKHYIIDT